MLRRPSAWLARAFVCALGLPRPRAVRRSRAQRPASRLVDMLWLAVVLGRRAPMRCGGSCCSRAPSLALQRRRRRRSASACSPWPACVVLIALASLIWVPIGVWIGLRPPGRRACSRWRSSWRPSRPTCCFPIAVVAIVAWHLDPDIWLSPLMVLGTQWYILFNVIAGASAFPTDLREAVDPVPAARLAVVAQGHPARHLSLLRHRRADRVAAARGTPASSPRSRAGATPS